MPVDERTFVADVKAWIDAILARRPDLPYGHAEVEEHEVGGRRRLDLIIYRRTVGRVALTGEVKMPDSVQGRRGPLDGDLVEDAFEKAARLGSPYYFTWNVREFVLFQTHQEGIPFMDRRLEGPAAVANAYVSDDVRRPDIEEAIKAFWEGLLERLMALERGARFRELPLDRRFILRMEASLERPITATWDELARQYDADREFRDNLNAWMRDEQGWETSEHPEVLRQNLERAARLSCYSLLNRLVFYEVLRRRFRVLPALVGIQPETGVELADALSRLFAGAVEVSLDYETIFEPSDWATGLPFLAPESADVWRIVMRDIEEFDFSRLDYDVIGRMYEQLISPEERRRYGQYYTSPDVVDLINAFCIRDSNAQAMDPACGGGTFLVRAYARKRAIALHADEERSHQELLAQLYGVDTTAFPVQLATINLAVRQLSDEPNYPQIVQRDFFDVRRELPFARLPSGEPDGHREVGVPVLDALVGNPPYIRQEELSREYKSRLNALVTAEWRGPSPPNFSGRSDIYVYFFGHGGALVRPGGYVGLITSVGWLDTEYGFRLQEFFLSHFKVLAVIESQVEQWFEDARVTTAVTILQREDDEAARRQNLVRFIQLRKPLADIWSDVLEGAVSEESEAARQEDMDAFRDLIEELAENQTTEYWRVRVLSQAELWDIGCRAQVESDEDEETGGPAAYRAGKWGQYLRAPDVWFDLIDRAGPRLVPLYELAEVRFGFKSGADKFYCVRDVTDRELGRLRPGEFRSRYGIRRQGTGRVRIVRDGDGGLHLVESRYLEPEFHRLTEANSIVVRASDVARLVINAPVSRASLRRTHLGQYIRYAEDRGWQEGSTVASRGRSGPWYDLRLRPRNQRAHMFWPMAQQYRHLVPWNEDGLPANHNLFDVWTREEVSARLLWAVLNSTIVALSKHQFGRMAGIEGDLKTEVVDVKMMLVPDPRSASRAVVRRLVAAAEAMAQRLSPRTLIEEFGYDDRQALDDATLELLGISDPSERRAIRSLIYEALAAQYEATRARELVAQRHRSGSRRRGQSPGEMADELWRDLEPSISLLEFPRDFVGRARGETRVDMPHGPVEVGRAMMETGRELRAGTVRIGGSDGAVLDVGSPARAQFLAAVSECGQYGTVDLPEDSTCEEAVRHFEGYKRELASRFLEVARERTRDQRRQRAIAAALMRKALGWRRDT